MSELVDMAFNFCSKARAKGLKRCEILFLVEAQIARLEGIEARERFMKNFVKGGEVYE